MEKDAAAREEPAGQRIIARCGEWSVSQHVCHAGPDQRPFEECHEGFTIAAVTSGSFVYHGGHGRALLHPGALLLGNHGACFACGHEHGTGDVCVALNLAPDYFAEISASAGGTGRFRFPAGMMPVSPRMLPVTTRLEAMALEPLRIEEAVSFIAGEVVSTLSGQAMVQVRISARDERRVSLILRHIEDNAERPIGLDSLAVMAGMSKYHLLRVFRRVAGVTPYQYLLMVRMRRAAVLLTSSLQGVSSIALDAGFGDLSTFNNRFRDQFGMNPLAYRRRGG